jgi:uncharacterized protein (TIGR03437 family)
MERKRKLYIAKAAVILGAIPLIVWAYEYGPNPGYCGVPKENGTCTSVGCHTGTTNNPANKGSVSISFPNGLTYVPGVKQHLTVTIADPATTQGAWGFQTTARLASDPATMGGSFAFTDQHTALMCSQPNFFVISAVCATGADPRGRCQQTDTPTCPTGQTLQYMEHSYTGYLQTMGTGSGTYQFDWTPPSSNVGNIVFYIAGNAGVPGPPSQNGDHIYATTYTLTPTAAVPAPTIAGSGVVNGASFQPGIVPNSWITIQGSNLASTTDTWDKAIVNGNLPTSLDGVTVQVGGKPAYVYFISPSQINALAPDVGTGTMSVTVSNANVTSPAATANAQTASPAFFVWAGKYPVATRQDASWAVKNGTFAGTTTVPAKPGDVIILWGTGFGPTNPAAPVGVQVPSDKTYSTASPVTVSINNIPAQVFGAALSPGFAGLYQVAIQVPPTAPDGDLPITASINGVSSPTGVVLTVQH